jgi:hypothetical protein
VRPPVRVMTPSGSRGAPSRRVTRRSGTRGGAIVRPTFRVSRAAARPYSTGVGVLVVTYRALPCDLRGREGLRDALDLDRRDGRRAHRACPVRDGAILRVRVLDDRDLIRLPGRHRPGWRLEHRRLALRHSG